MRIAAWLDVLGERLFLDGRLLWMVGFAALLVFFVRFSFMRGSRVVPFVLAGLVGFLGVQVTGCQEVRGPEGCLILTYVSPGDLDSAVDQAIGSVVPAAASAGLWCMVVLIRGKGRGRRGDVEQLKCPCCSYSLVGLLEARCPECGTRFDADLVEKSLAAVNRARGDR